jgi:copper chaperone CopZ
MKKVLIIISSLLIAASTNAQITKAVLTATGLTCSMCSKATYKQLTSIPEVEKVEADLNKTAFVIYFKSGSQVNAGVLKQKVEDAGFSVGELIVYYHFARQKSGDNGTFTANDITYTFIDTKSEILEGITKLKVLDKGFVTEKVYKKYAKMGKQYPSYIASNNNLYHIKPI